MLFAILLGIAALIFSSALGDPPADPSQPLVAKFPAELVEAVAFSPDGKPSPRVDGIIPSVCGTWERWA